MCLSLFSRMAGLNLEISLLFFGIFLRGLLWKGLRYSFHRWIDFLNTSNLRIKSILLSVSYDDIEIHLFPFVFWNLTSQDAVIFQISGKYALLWSCDTEFHQKFLFVLIWMSVQRSRFAAYLFWMHQHVRNSKGIPCSEYAPKNIAIYFFFFFDKSMLYKRIPYNLLARS